MRATKLLSVSVTLWAVVVGADSASAGMEFAELPIKPPPPTWRSRRCPTVNSGARVMIMDGAPPTGIKSGARAIITSPWESGERCPSPGLILARG